MERDRIIANERRLLKEREDREREQREQQERKAREAWRARQPSPPRPTAAPGPVDRFGLTTAPLRRSPEPARTYPVYGGYMTYQPPKPAAEEARQKRKDEEKREEQVCE